MLGPLGQPPALLRNTTSGTQYSFEDDDDVEIIEEEDGSCVARAGPLVLSRADLRRRRDATVQEVVELLAVSSDDALLLLRHFRWSSEELGEAFFLDAEAVQSAAGVSCTAVAAARAPEALCGICFTELPTPVLRCGHTAYCGECWGSYNR